MDAYTYIIVVIICILAATIIALYTGYIVHKDKKEQYKHLKQDVIDKLNENINNSEDVKFTLNNLLKVLRKNQNENISLKNNLRICICSPEGKKKFWFSLYFDKENIRFDYDGILEAYRMKFNEEFDIDKVFNYKIAFIDTSYEDAFTNIYIKEPPTNI